MRTPLKLGAYVTSSANRPNASVVLCGHLRGTRLQLTMWLEVASFLMARTQGILHP